LPQTFLQGLVG